MSEIAWNLRCFRGPSGSLPDGRGSHGEFFSGLLNLHHGLQSARRSANDDYPVGA